MGVGLLTVALVAAQFASFLPVVGRFVPARASAAGPAGNVYVSNETDGTVSVIDPATNFVITTINVGGTPYGVTVRPGGSQVWVANYAGQRVDVIDVATNTVVTSAAIAGSPHSVAFNPSGTRAYVTVPTSTNPLAQDTVWIFDATLTPPFPMATIKVGGFPAGLTMRPDGKRLYVANYGAALGNTVSVIDTDPGSPTQNQKIADITVGTGPFQIALQPDGSRAYVADRGSDQVTVINTATNAVVTTIATGGGSIFVAVNSAGTAAYVTNIDDSSVSVIDTTTNTVSATWANVGLAPRGIALSLDGSRAYIASSSNDEVSVYDVSGSYVDTIGVGTEPFFVAVIPAVPQISGLSKCDNGDGSTLLTGATVDLYSGSVLVASTLSDANGAYTFLGVAPNATYTLVYTKTFVDGTSFTITCSTKVTTDASGNGAGGTGAFINNRHNHTWPGAYQIASGATVTDYVFQQGQSTWFKIPITRGQRVTVKLTGVPADYSLALYKDIGALYQKEIAALTSDGLTAVNAHDASVSPDALSPDELSPDELSPDELSPDALSPDELSPDELSPDELSPDELSPDELSPDALSPDELSPDELSPDELSPDELSAAYAGAQTAALIGVSAHVGLSPEQISRNTWDNTGFFYMRVRGHNGAYDASTSFTIQATTTDVSCGGATLVDYPASAALATGKTTLIFTNSARLGADGPAFVSVPNGKLQTLANAASVNGVVVDLATLPAFNAVAGNAYSQWDANKSCPSAANIVAHSIKDIINAYAAANSSLKYIVLAGNDNVIPFFRQPDQSGLGSEKDYFPSVKDPTPSQASLRLGYVLTQDFYGSLRPVSRFDHELYLPDLAVGRLVETVPQMTAVIDAYTLAGGSVAPTTALVTGYDFLSDTAAFIAQQLQANALTVDKSLIQPIGDTSSSPSAWTGDQLKAKVLGPTSYGILSLNAHFSASTMLAADFATRMRTSDIAALPAADTRFRNALVLSTGCHSGFGVVDGDQTALTDPMDWAQTFAARGATVIGGTGYQYGDTDFMKYSEQILANTTLELRYDTGSIPIGVALANAKRSYLSSLASLGGIDEKALAEATLYGLPMLGYNLPAGSRLLRPSETTVPAPIPGTSAGLSVASVSPSYTLTRNTRSLANLGGTGNQTAVWYDINGNVSVSPGAPVLPQLSLDAAKVGKSVRGAVLLTATYADENATPFTDVATTEVRGAHARSTTEVFTPVRPFTLNHFAGAHLVSTPFQFHSTPGSATGVARRFTTETFKLYYSTLTDARALAASPSVTRVFLSPDGAGNVDVVVIVSGLTSVGVEEVFATFTGEAGSLYGKWTSTAPLTLQSSVSSGTDATHTVSVFANTYTGTIPLASTNANDLRVIIQAAGGNGLVTWASNDGAYYRVPNETVTAGDPKISTALTLTVPASGTYRTNVPVSATLTAAGAPLAGKPVAFRSNGVRVDATTNASGIASAQLFLTSAPGIANVSVGFAEEQHYLASGAQAQLTVNKAPTSFTTLDPAPIPTGGTVLLATLRSESGETLGAQLVTITGGGHTVQTFTDGYGRVRLDSADGFPTGTYSLAIAYAGNDRYLPSSTTDNLIVVVFDPTTFVTGAGWFMTRGDSVGLVPSKKTNFGFNLKYKAGTTVPTGSLEFVAKESNVNLHATSFDWLVIASGTADAVGHATVNGAAGWSFRLTLVDGSPDRFSLTIWQDGTTSESAPTYRTNSTVLGSGSIAVH